MDIKVVDNQGKEIVEEKRVPGEPAETTNFSDLLITSVGEMFDLRPVEMGAMRDKIQLLIDYAKTQVEEQSMENIKWAIRSLGYKLGTPPLGEKLINYLSRYAYLHLEGLEIEKEKEKYIKNSMK